MPAVGNLVSRGVIVMYGVVDPMGVNKANICASLFLKCLRLLVCFLNSMAVHLILLI
jgi:hypothetical protein